MSVVKLIWIIIMWAI